MIASHWHAAGEIQHWLTRALDLLYPTRCGGCGTAGHGWWCDRCLAKAQALELVNPTRTIAMESPWSGMVIPVFSVMPFLEPIRSGIHALKYEGCPQLAEPFGQWLAGAWRRYGMLGDVLVPVPLHIVRQRERGYNQSERLARVLSLAIRVPLDIDNVRRVRHTAQQALLNAAERKLNVRDAFSASTDRSSGRHIVAVDDVFTTGATIVECARALLSAGARQVTAITLTRAT